MTSSYSRSRSLRRFTHASVLCAAGWLAPSLAHADPPAPVAPPLTQAAPAPLPPAPPPTPLPLPPSTVAPPPAAAPPCAAPPPGAPPGGHWVYVTEPAGTSPPAGPKLPPAQVSGAGPGSAQGTLFERDNTWDLNLDGALGRFLGSDGDKWTGFGRVRGGALFIRDSFYTSVGATYEYSTLSKGTFGVQGEIMHIESGFWAQLGGMLDVSAHPGGMAAVGWSLFGVEAQVRDYSNDGLGTGVAIYGKIRIPVSVIARVFKKHPAAAAPAPSAAASGPAVAPPPPAAPSP